MVGVIIVVVVVLVFGVGAAAEGGAAFGTGAANRRKVKTHRSAHRVAAYSKEGAYGLREEGHGCLLVRGW